MELVLLYYWFIESRKGESEKERVRCWFKCLGKGRRRWRPVRSTPSLPREHCYRVRLKRKWEREIGDLKVRTEILWRGKMMQHQKRTLTVWVKLNLLTFEQLATCGKFFVLWPVLWSVSLSSISYLVESMSHKLAAAVLCTFMLQTSADRTQQRQQEHRHQIDFRLNLADRWCTLASVVHCSKKG